MTAGAAALAKRRRCAYKTGVPPLVVILVVVALFAALSIYGPVAADRRRKALAAWAAGRGLSFSSRHDYGMAGRFPEFACLRQGENRYAYNVVRGVWENRPFHAFDYHYETYTHHKGRRQTHHHHFSAAIMTSDVPLQPLVIRPETMFDRVAEFVGVDDIDFESAEFSRRFHVRAPSKKWAYDVIHARTMEFLLGMPDFHLQFDRSHVMAHRTRRYEIPDIEAAANVMRGILDRLPDYVVKAQQGHA